MANFNLYKPNGNWCYRIVRPSDGYVMAAATGIPASDTTLANSAVAMTYSAVLHGFPISINSNLPAGEYDILFYNVAAAAIAATDEVVIGRRFQKSQAGFLVQPLIKLLDI